MIDVGLMRRSTGFLLLFLVVFCGSAGVVQAQDLYASRVVLLPVDYSDQGADAPKSESLQETLESGLSRAWSGEVVAGERLTTAMNAAFVTEDDKRALIKLEQDVEAAAQVFYTESPGKALPTLESLIARSGALLPSLGSHPKAALALIRAHLLVWWGMKSSGEKDRLRAHMETTVRLFPAAIVNSVDVPPYVAEAHSAAFGSLQESGLTLNIKLNNADGPCDILLNGVGVGDGKTASIRVAKGQAYYVAAQCGASALPARRIVLDADREVRLDMVLADRAFVRGGKQVARVESADDVADLVSVAAAFGQTLEAGTTVLAGIVEEDGRRVLQLDRIDNSTRARVCSVRIVVTDDSRPVMYDPALRAVAFVKPTPDTMLFAAGDNVYRTPDEYIEYKSAESIQHVFTWTSAGLAAVALGTGVAMNFVGASDQEALDKCVLSASCRGTKEVEALRDDVDRAVILRDSFYIASGVFAVGAAVLYFVESPDPNDYLAPQGVSLLPALGPDFVGLRFGGGFP